MEAQTFILTEIPPSTNGLFSTVKTAGGGTRRVRSMKYRSWAEVAKWQLLAHKPKMMTGAIGLDIRLKKPREGVDVSNRIKAVEDLLSGVVYEDDSQVVIVTIAWDAAAPGCIVTVRPA